VKRRTALQVQDGDLCERALPERACSSSIDLTSSASEPAPHMEETQRYGRRTLEALRATPSCRRSITSGSTLTWMLSSPAPLATLKAP
jgi:hypothetical protein